MRRPIPWAVVLPAALVLPAIASCGPDAPADAVGAVESIDSVGTRVVTNASAAPTDTVSPSLRWRYGTDPSQYLFERITFGVLRSDGAAVISDLGAREVVVVAPGGASHTVLARSGQGPSEVAGPRQLVAGPDGSVWIEDVRGGKLMQFSGDSLARVLTGPSNPTTSAGLMPIGTNDDGRLLLTTARYQPNFTEPWLHASMVVLEPGATSLDTLGTFPYVPRVDEPPVSPFMEYGVFAIAGGRFVTARTDIPELRWHGADGRVAQRARWAAETIYPNADDFEESLASIRESNRRMNPGRTEEEYEAMFERAAAQWALDETEPVRLFDEIVGAADGSVWIAPFSANRRYPPGRTEWTVVSPDGEWLGVAQFPRPTSLLHVTSELILGVQVGEFDVQSLGVWENPFGL